MTKFDPERVLRILHEEGVRFVLVGGLAAVVHGSTVVTADTDITPRRDHDNLDRLAVALRRLGARLRTDHEPDGVVFPVDADFLAAQPMMLNLVTDSGDLDLTFTPSGFPGGFDELARAATPVQVVDIELTLVASLEDVITSKRAAGRDKDRAALPYLEELSAELSDRADGPAAGNLRP